MDAAMAFARLATTLRYEDLPPAVIEVARKDILDTVGTMLAGSRGEGAAEMAGLVEELGGKPESSVVSYGFKVPCTEAALVNGFMAHSADYDDTYDTALIHCGAPVIPAALATAQRKGKVNGREMIVAVTLGLELMCRIGLAKEEGRWGGGWSGSRIYGFLGGALASARLLGLDEEHTSSALGLAYAQAAGNLQGVREGVLARDFDMGCASRGGALAALAAQRGITGGHNCLEGDFGLFNVFHQGRYDPKALVSDLGKRFEMTNLSFKPYPCARPIHPFVDAALELERQHHFKPQDIIEVIGYVDEEPYLQFDPLQAKQNPRTANEAKLSIPYAMAVALVKGRVAIADFTERAIADPEVISVARKAVPKLDASLARPKEIPPAVVEVRTGEGVYSARSEYPSGHPKNPLSMESLVLKFRDCAAHAHTPLPDETVSRIIDTVAHLEDVSDVGQLIRLVG